jgi:AraC-like DNA-binding protein
MRYAEYPPSAALAPVVDCYWFLEGPGSGVPEPIIPDGRIEIVFHYGARFSRHLDAGPIERQAPSLVVGQMLAPISISHHGIAGVAGIRLRPAAARAVVGCSAVDLTDRFVDLESVFGATATLRERLAGAEDDTARVALLASWLEPRVRGVPARDVDAAVAAIASTGGRVDLVRVAVHAGIGLRQLERRFLADVGVAPKTFARMVRLQAALRQIRDGHPLADVAQTCGYYDQPHMARDFSLLARTSPAAWRRHAGELTPLFVAR